MCQPSARSKMSTIRPSAHDPPPWFFVSVADKGVRGCVSGLESTLVGWYVSVDSKGDGCQGGWCW